VAERPHATQGRFAVGSCQVTSHARFAGDHPRSCSPETGCGSLTAAILIGNRQLNRALHIIAITRVRIDPTTRAYIARKETEGKTRIEAMRCLVQRFRSGLLLSALGAAGMPTQGSCLNCRR
jgi:hypothetical protein